MPILERSLVQVFTGEGKGKTSAAFGLAWRMLGHGGKVYVCQFLKPVDIATGEAKLAGQFAGHLTLERLAEPWDMRKGTDDAEQVARMTAAIGAKLAAVRQIAQEGRYDLMILDEIVLCVSMGLARREDVYAIIDQRARHTELILTGRGADDDLIERADLVTQIGSTKHPYEQGMTARRGIEY